MERMMGIRRGVWRIGERMFSACLVFASAALVVGAFSSSATAATAATALSASQLAAAKQCPWPACARVISDVKAGAKLQKLPSKLSPSLLNASTDLFPPPGLKGCVVYTAPVSTPGACVYNAGAPKQMALIGDSHAEMWAPAVAAIAQANGYSLLFLAKIPCPLPMAEFWNALKETPNTQCTPWKKWAIARIQQFNPSIVVAATQDHQLYNVKALPVSQPVYTKALTTTLKDLSAPGRRVVLLGDISYLTQTGPICLAAHEGSIQSCSTPTSEAVSKQYQSSEASAASKAGAQFVDIIPWLCTPTTCPPVVENFDVYSDSSHLTAAYATSLVPVLSEALGLGASSGN
jgi:hypothetical protein